MEPVVTFILISYNETNDLYVSLGSLLCQKNPLWKAVVYHDGPNENTKRIVESFNDPRITYMESEERRGQWGVYNRIDALKLVDTPYVIQSTVQEYYTPITVDAVAKNQGQDIVIWNTAHHHFQYNTLDVQLRVKAIDWSNFAIKTNIARIVGINHPTEFCADGLFIEDCVKSGLIQKAVKVSKVLSIKN